MSKFCVITAVNKEDVLRRNLLQSPSIASGALPVVTESDCPSAAKAYNAGRRQTDAEYLIFAHQDVYLPAGWDRRLQAAVVALKNEPWAVLGVWGIRESGDYAGRVWCSGGNTEHFVSIAEPAEVVSIDEIVIVVNAAAGLEFDEELPGFHLYATDLILQARRRGLKTFVIDAPVVHNSWCNPQPLGAGFWAAYRFMQKKWRDTLPVKTCTVDITPHAWPLWKRWAKNEIRRLRGKIVARPPAPDPRAIAERLGYESIASSSVA